MIMTCLLLITIQQFNSRVRKSCLNTVIIEVQKYMLRHTLDDFHVTRDIRYICKTSLLEVKDETRRRSDTP